MNTPRIAIMGGSGLYQMDGVTITEERAIATPYGDPSDCLRFGTMEGVPVVFLPRHGRHHQYSPSEINYRANIWALKSVGIEQIISVSAVGSMKEELKQGDFVVVDQFIDRTRSRPYTFFENGVVAHVAFANPVCTELAQRLVQAGTSAGITVHNGGTYVCIEGPTFSTKAESLLFRSWGVDVIGMTNYQEAKLAREAELCYSTIALVTDYDCWHESEEVVDNAAVLAAVKQNVANVQLLIKTAITGVERTRACACATALDGQLMTAADHISLSARERLEPILGKYLHD